MENTALSKGLTEIACTFSFLVFRREETKWMVCKYRCLENNRIFTATGTNLPVTKKVTVNLVGNYETDAATGRKTFRVNYYEIITPKEETEVVAYLRALKCGIGTEKANRIYRKFGERTFEIIENEPYKLTEVRGISGKAVERLLKAQKENSQIRELIKLFAQAGIKCTGDAAATIADKLGRESEKTVRANPYVLYDRNLVPFDRADALGEALGFEKTDAKRLSSGIQKVLSDYAASGSVCMPKAELLKAMTRYLDIDEKTAVNQLNAEWSAGRLKAANGMIFSTERYRQEEMIAEHLKRLMTAGTEAVKQIDGFIDDYEKANLVLEQAQRAAVAAVFQNPVTIITGGPGVGKTTVIRAILTVHKRVYGERSHPILMAPTGKAARRMSETTGYPAVTIHKAIGYKGEIDGEYQCDGERLDGNLVIIDEASMMDQQITGILLNRIKEGTRVVFVGDPDQLPSVGAGNVLHDMLLSEVIPSVKLTVVKRQAGDSLIVKNAHLINTGNTNLVYGDRFHLIETGSEKETFQRACGVYLALARSYGTDSVVLLNPQRNSTNISVDWFNWAIQERLNPAIPGNPEIHLGAKVFRMGDKVMQMKNTESAQNGDCGYIRNITAEPDPDDPDSVVYYAEIDFNDSGVVLRYSQEDMRHVDLGYCITTHKSQGSEYRYVIMIVTTAHPAMLKRKILYTGVTRSKETVYIVGQTVALNAAISCSAGETRHTLLAPRLRAAFK